MTAPGPLELSEISEWGMEADVVIVGLGAAGACAAIEADAAGASTIVLEAASGGGGSSAMSGGLVYMGGGTPIQEQCGYEDSPDNMYAFLMAACGPDPDATKIRAYCDGSVDHYHWLVDNGVPFKAEFYPEPGLESPNEAGLVYSGGEDAWPFDRVATPAPRAHKPQVAGTAGAFLMECLLSAVGACGAEIEYDIAADRLIVAGGTVVGVSARRGGQSIAIRARRGVVLCAGGFVLDDDMVDQHAPLVGRCSLRIGSDHDRGSGIRMAQSVGARTRRMDAVEVALPFTPPRSLAAGIFVNARGQRFINEDTYYGRVGQEALFRQDGQVYLIVDEELYEPTRAGQHAEWVCETVDELEAEMGLPRGSLASTLHYYNESAANGEDPLFHKAADFLQPLHPPLGAYNFSVDSAYYATFTLGGLQTTVPGEVIDLAGSPIPGLYAAGRTTSGVAALGYASGISLGDSTFFGRLAGRAAADPQTTVIEEE